MTGGTFDLGGNDQTLAGLSGSGGAITLGSGDLTVNQAGATAFNGKISGAGGVTKTGAGILALNGASSYTGATTVDAGTLQLGAGGSLASTTALIVNGGTFDLENGGQTVGSLSGTGGAITLGNGTLTVKQSITTSFLGDISGSGGLTKAGRGTLILDGTNDYTGLTSVDGGVLEIGDADHTRPASWARSRRRGRQAAGPWHHRRRCRQYRRRRALARRQHRHADPRRRLHPGPDQPAADRGLADGGLPAQCPGQCQPRRQTGPGL